jgi:hypothetical protein
MRFEGLTDPLLTPKVWGVSVYRCISASLLAEFDGLNYRTSYTLKGQPISFPREG